MTEAYNIFLFAERRPAGVPEFQKNPSGTYTVYPHEIFCRVFEDGKICSHDTKFESASTVRTHISSAHPDVSLEPGLKGRPNNAIKEAGAIDQELVAQAVLEARGIKRKTAQKSSVAAADNDDAAPAGPPKTPTKRKAEPKANGSVKKPRKNAKAPVAEIKTEEAASEVA